MSTTTNYGLRKFVLSESDWGDAMNTNLDEIDAAIHGIVLSGGGITSFLFTQSSPSTSWVIVHNLSRTPSVTVIDSAGTRVFGEVHHDSSNQVTLTFSAAFGGTAYLV